MNIEKYLEMAVDFGFKLLIFIIILVVGFYLIKLIMKIVNKSKGYNKLEDNVKSFINSFINIVLKILLLITGLSYLGIPMTSMLALVGSCGIAIGLALQGGLSNIAGGLMILLFKPFKSGDYISTHTDEGTVNSITIFHTNLTTVDNKKVVIPNGPLSNTTIVNYTAMKKRRLDLDISVSYDSDVDKVKKVILKVIKKHKEILEDEDKFVRLTSHEQSSLKFTIRVWVKCDDYFPLKFDLLEELFDEFKKEKIEIPYNKLDINIKK